jgi:hypothetical protein
MITEEDGERKTNQHLNVADVKSCFGNVYHFANYL